MSYFPMFVELRDKPCLIIGGGRIAYHKVKVLMDFEARIMVVAPKLLPEILETAGIDFREKPFEEKDLDGKELVVAATDDMELNHRISLACQKARIPVNVVDCPEECTFIFPAYVKEQEVVAAFSSGGQSPVITQYLKEQTQPVLKPLIGELAACLGSLRKTVQECDATRGAGKNIYRELLQLGLEKDRLPTAEEIEAVIYRYKEGRIKYKE